MPESFGIQVAESPEELALLLIELERGMPCAAVRGQWKESAHSTTAPTMRGHGTPIVF
jgi:hypothetical protein